MDDAAEVLLETEPDALDLTVRRGGADEVAAGPATTASSQPDAPEMLDFYAQRSEIFLDVFLLTDDEPQLLAGGDGLEPDRSEPASRALLDDLRSDEGMGGLPHEMWLTYLRLDTPAAAAAGVDGEVLGPGVVTVDTDLRHSRFEPAELRVRAGTVVRFEVDNLAPIHHELIVGPPEAHATHAEGAHHRHPPVSGELSLGSLEDGMTFYELDEPGTVVMACHLPGHVEHGMVGSVEVVP